MKDSLLIGGQPLGVGAFDGNPYLNSIDGTGTQKSMGARSASTSGIIGDVGVTANSTNGMSAGDSADWSSGSFSHDLLQTLNLEYTSPNSSSSSSMGETQDSEDLRVSNQEAAYGTMKVAKRSVFSPQERSVFNTHYNVLEDTARDYKPRCDSFSFPQPQIHSGRGRDGSYHSQHIPPRAKGHGDTYSPSEDDAFLYVDSDVSSYRDNAFASPSVSGADMHGMNVPYLQRVNTSAPQYHTADDVNLPISSMPARDYLRDGIRFADVEFKAGRREFFVLELSRQPTEIRKNDFVLVEADRGRDIGRIVESYYPNSVPPRIATTVNRRVLRPANKEEIVQLLQKAKAEASCVEHAKIKAMEFGLPILVVDAEYQFDRKKLTFFFESSVRVDFRDLVRELFKTYRTRIWMRGRDKGGANVWEASESGEDLVDSAALHGYPHLAAALGRPAATSGTYGTGSSSWGAREAVQGQRAYDNGSRSADVQSVWQPVVSDARQQRYAPPAPQGHAYRGAHGYRPNAPGGNNLNHRILGGSYGATFDR